MSLFEKKFIKPLYNSYCFSNIPKTVQFLLDATKNLGLPQDTIPKDKYQKVVFFFVDAFGWKFFEKNKNKYPSLKRFIDRGIVSKITAQFPSTTAAEVTTVNTGSTVGDHGIYEWFYYEPKLDAVIAPLLFSYAGDKARDTLKSSDINPATLYPTTTIYQQLKKQGIKSYTFLPSDFAFSEYNLAVNKGDNIFPYNTLAQGLTDISNTIIKEKQNSYYFFYYGKIDYIGHQYGTDSRYFESEIELFFTALENIFFKFIDGKVKDTIILLSADHGQTDVDPKNTFYLNKKIKNISKYFKTTKNGKPIVPAGSCRDMFLHVKEEFIDELQQILIKKLMGKAEVYQTKKLINQGFFGPKISSKFLSRVGNLVILPYMKETVWWYEKDIFEQKFIGHHGGLTPEEMEIPFLALPM